LSLFTYEGLKQKKAYREYGTLASASGRIKERNETRIVRRRKA